MKRIAQAFLLTGTAFFSLAEAGGGGPPLAFEELPHLRALTGQAFDETCLLEAKTQQDLLCGVDEVARRYSRKQSLRAWAEKDCQTRQKLSNRLETLRNRLTDFPGSSHTDFVISNDSIDDVKAHADTFFRTHYAKQSAYVSALARLALSRTENAEVRREAAAMLAFEATQANELGKLK